MSDPILPIEIPEPSGEGARGERLREFVAAFRLPLLLIVTAINLLPFLLSVPYVNRFEAYAAEGVFATLVLAAHFNASLRVLGAIALAGVALITGMVLSNLPDEGGQDVKAATLIQIGGTPTRTLNAFGYEWVLRREGSVVRLGESGHPEATYDVDGPANSMAACGQSLLITHGDGQLTRLARSDGHKIDSVDYGNESGDVICRAGFVFVTEPASGKIMQYTLKGLDFVREFEIVSQVTSITSDDRAIWVLDGQAGIVVGIRYRARGTKLIGPFNARGAVQVLRAGAYVWVLHRDISCIRRLDLDRRVEIGPGIPVGRSPSRMHEADGKILVSDWDDGSILLIDIDTAKALGPPIVVGKEPRIADADIFGDRLIGIDERGGTVARLDDKEQREHRKDQPYKAGPECQP
jgi:hypothetical protein